MQITIQEYSAHNQHDLNRCDSTFTVDSKLVLHAESNLLRYTIVSVTPYTKTYPRHEIDIEGELAQQEKGIFFAYADGQIAGQFILRENWNRFAYIDDIAVDARFRRCGIGRAFIAHAIAWTKMRNLPGIMLETQDINVGACLFYERCGFELAGFDRYLYCGLAPNLDEIALYWYMFLS